MITQVLKSLSSIVERNDTGRVYVMDHGEQRLEPIARCCSHVTRHTG